MTKISESFDKISELFLTNSEIFCDFSEKVHLRWKDRKKKKEIPLKALPLLFVHITQNQYLCRWLPYAQPLLATHYSS